MVINSNLSNPNYEIGKEYSWGRCISSEELKQIEEANVERAEKFPRTATHVPMNTATLLSMFEEKFTKQMQLSEPRHLISRQEDTILTRYNIGWESWNQDSNVTKEIILLNNHTKKWRVTLANGATVGICKNGEVFAEHVHTRKHTKNVWEDMDYFFYSAVKPMISNFTKRDQESIKWKESPTLTTEELHDFVIRSYEDNIIPVTEIKPVLKHLKNPEHPEFKDHNMYNVYQAYTSTWRDTNPFTMARKCNKLRSLVNDTYDTITGFEEPIDMDLVDTDLNTDGVI